MIEEHLFLRFIPFPVLKSEVFYFSDKNKVQFIFIGAIIWYVWYN